MGRPTLPGQGVADPAALDTRELKEARSPRRLRAASRVGRLWNAFVAGCDGIISPRREPWQLLWWTFRADAFVIAGAVSFHESRRTMLKQALLG